MRLKGTPAKVWCGKEEMETQRWMPEGLQMLQPLEPWELREDIISHPLLPVSTCDMALQGAWRESYIACWTCLRRSRTSLSLPYYVQISQESLSNMVAMKKTWFFEILAYFVKGDIIDYLLLLLGNSDIIFLWSHCQVLFSQQECEHSKILFCGVVSDDHKERKT